MAETFPAAGAPPAECLAFVEQNVTTSSSVLRERLFKELFLPILRNESISIDELVGQSGRIILSTINIYHQRQEVVLVEEAVALLARRSAKFANSLTQYVPMAQKKLPATPAAGAGFHTQLTLIRWVTTLLRTALAHIKEQATFGPFIVAFAKLVDNVSNAPIRSKEATYSRVSQLLTELPETYGLILKHLKAMEPTLETCALTGILLDRGVRPPLLPNASLADHRQTFLDMYAATIMGGKLKPTQAHHAAYLPLIEVLTHDEFSNVVWPNIDRALKRSPETAVGLLEYLLSKINLDLSRYALESILPSTLPFVKGEDESRRNSAVGAIEQLARHSSDLEVVTGIIAALAGSVTGVDSRWHQRIGVYGALKGVMNAAKTRANSSTLGTAAAASLLEWLKKESHQETTVAALDALGAAVARCQQLPAGFVEAFSNGINIKKTPKEEIRRAHILALGAALHPGTYAQAMPLVEGLCALVAEANAHPPYYAEGISGLRVLVELASGEGAIDAALREKGIYGIAAAPTSFVKRVGGNEWISVAHVALLESLLRAHGDRLIEANGRACVQSLTATLLALLTHESHNVQTAARAAVQRMHPHVPALSEDLIAAWPARLVELAPKLTDEGGEDSAGKMLRHVVVEAFKVTVAPDGDIAAIAPQIVILSQHPTIATGQHASALLATLCKTRPALQAACANEAATSVVPAIFGPAALGSSDVLYRRAGVQAVQTLASPQWAEGAAVDAVMKALLPYAESHARALEEVPAMDWTIFNVPEGQLAAETKAEAVVDDNRSKRRDKSQRGLYSFEDEEWEREMRKKQAEESKKKRSKAEEAEFQAALERESIVRNRVRTTVASAEISFAALQALVEANAPAVHARLHLILPVWSYMLKMEHLARSAASSFFDLQPALADAFDQQTRPAIAGVVRVLNDDASGEEWRHESVGTLLTRVLPKLPSDTFSAPAVAFLFPAIAFVLRSNNFEPALHGCALELITRHATLGRELPRAQLITLLLETLAHRPRFAKEAHNTLVALTAGIGEDDLNALLDGFLYSEKEVRQATLDALAVVEPLLKRVRSDPNGPHLLARLFFAAQDEDGTAAAGAAKGDAEGEGEGSAATVASPVGSSNAAMAGDLLRKLDESPIDYKNGPIYGYILPLLSNNSMVTRKCAGRALAASVRREPRSSAAVVAALIAQFVAHIPPQRPRDAGFTRTFEKRDELDPVTLQRYLETREGVSSAFGALAGVLSAADLRTVFTVMLEKGLADESASVRELMIEAGVRIIAEQGKDAVRDLMPIFEEQLQKPTTNDVEDMVREGLVIFVGTLAKHLDKDDPRVIVTLERLLEALTIPSAAVQIAVAKCLPALMPAVKPVVDRYVDQLMTRLLTSESYGQRKGAAYGLAGMVKGLSLAALKQYNIMTRLEETIADAKASADAREGVMFAFECLSMTLGRMFEPYVVHIMGHLLDRFGDSSANVRDATQEAARAIMGQLTARGVKLVLPMLLSKLSERQWRTKQGGVQILGTMAYCAPKQLSQCLPEVVPKLIEVLTDTHPKVQEASREALQVIGSVITNPEIQKHVNVILGAINDPNHSTVPALDSLLQTSFVHRIDAPSLALVIPILHRGLRERGTETKKKASKIVGNMCTLTDPKDLEAYLPLLLPDLKVVLVDPIPEVRSVAAAALGSLVNGMGEEQFTDLVPWLVSTLKSDAGAVERSGAAQGLSEVLAALGEDHFERMLPDLLANTNNVRAVVREGFFNVFVFMPPILGPSFQKFIGRVLPAVLQGLADESEFVRDTAFRSGQVLVNSFGKSSVPILLPALEEGLFDDNWRIRQSSVSLLGDLLFLISGVSGNIQVNEDSDDEGISTEAHGKALSRYLGEEARARVLAALYMMRCDVSAIVRQSALQVWKQIISHTPRTLREILPQLMSTLIKHLASSNPDKRQVAGRCLGDIVKKLGDRVLPDIIPMLETGLQSGDSDTRQGVCLGLSEVMASAGKEYLDAYVEALVPAVRKALCDESGDVREAAAQAFDMLYGNVGVKALDDILPAMLAQLENPDAGARVLDGLRQILAVRSTVVLPYLLPKLLKPPLSAFNCRAIGALADVAGASLNRHLNSILPAVMDTMATGDAESKELAKQAAQNVVMAVNEDGLTHLVNELLAAMKPEQPHVTRENAALLAGDLAAKTKADLSQFVQPLFRSLLRLMGEVNPALHTAGLQALTSMTGALNKEESTQYIIPVRTIFRHIREDMLTNRDDKSVPGFNLPQGLEPLWPMFQHGLMYGSAELREQAALAIGDLADLTSPAAFKPYVLKFTGPLIRIVGDRFTYQLKQAILTALMIIIIKGGVNTRPIHPQLQSTLIKILVDPTRSVRLVAAKTLMALVPLQLKIDQMITELLNGVKASESQIRETMLRALYSALAEAGDKASEKALIGLQAPLLELFASEDEGCRMMAAKALGASLKFVPAPALSSMLESLVASANANWAVRHSNAVAIAALLKVGPAVLQPHCDDVCACIVRQLRDDKVPVRQAAVQSAGRLVVQPYAGNHVANLMPTLAALLTDPVNDVRRTAIVVVKTAAKLQPEITGQFLGELVPPLMTAVKDRNMPVKLAAERALLYVLQMQDGSQEVLTRHTGTLPKSAASDLLGYATRVLVKLNTSEPSDDESDADKDTEGGGAGAAPQ